MVLAVLIGCGASSCAGRETQLAVELAEELAEELAAGHDAGCGAGRGTTYVGRALGSSSQRDV